MADKTRYHGIDSLEYRDLSSIQQVALLHRTLIPTSPAVMLGPEFLEHYYYPRLLRDNLIYCDYYSYDHQIAGFIAYTFDPAKFFEKGIRNNFFFLTKLLLRIFLKDPGRITKLLKGSQLEKAHNDCSPKEAAVLSFGVLSEFRDRRFVQTTGRYISRELFEHAAEVIKGHGFDKVRMILEPDNRETMLFYMQFNCQYEKMTAMGRTWMKVTLNLC